MYMYAFTITALRTYNITSVHVHVTASHIMAILCIQGLQWLISIYRYSNFSSLLRLYYLYEKSPKKTRELGEIVQDLKEVFKLPKSGNVHDGLQGSRRLTHK